MIYGGNAVQKITFSTTTPTTNINPSLISGVLSLSYDANGDGTLEKTAPFAFSESNYTTSAANMQAAFRSLGGVLTDVTVTADTSVDYTIAFGDASKGASMNPIQINYMAWSSGYLPTAEVTRTCSRGPSDCSIRSRGFLFHRPIPRKRPSR